jgi:hypothetical protein
VSPLPLPLAALLQICGTQNREYMPPMKKSVIIGERMILITNMRHMNIINPVEAFEMSTQAN